MNKIIRTGLAALLPLSMFSHADAVDRVSALHSDIRVAASGELTVTETLELQTGPREALRGVAREFAADYRDRRGARARVPLVIDKVMRNGRPEPFALERAAGGMRLRTGAPGRALPRGKHVFQIVYRTAGQVGFLDQHDELYWSVGGGWSFAFERLSAEVTFERGVAADEMKLDALTGAANARGQDFHAFVRQGSAAFRATRALGAREGMWITVAFPKGVVTRPSALERAAGYLWAHRGVPVGAALAALMLALLLACRWQLRRVPAPAPSALPPEGIGPGGVRFIARNGYDERCLGAALLGLKSRGYLTIREHGERLRLEKTGAEVQWFPGEEALARGLLLERNPYIRRHGRALEEAGARFARELARAFGRRRWTDEGSFVLAAAGIGATGVLAMIALDTPPAAVFAMSGVIVLTLVFFSLKFLPLYRAAGSSHRRAIDALRSYLERAEPKNEDEIERLLPYAVALELEQPWGKRLAAAVPAALVELTPRARDKAPAPPRRPLRHTRSAAA